MSEHFCQAFPLDPEDLVEPTLTQVSVDKQYPLPCLSDCHGEVSGHARQQLPAGPGDQIRLLGSRGDQHSCPESSYRLDHRVTGLIDRNKVTFPKLQRVCLRNSRCLLIRFRRPEVASGTLA